jgi:hypothetical protein
VTVSRIRATLISALVLGIAALALAGCSSSTAGPTRRAEVASVVETGTLFRGSSGFFWTDNAPSISLDAALAKIDATVLLPDAAVVGTMTHVVSDPTAVSADGKPGLLVAYSSGVQLSVGYPLRGLAVETGAAPFTDGRKTANTLRQIDGSPVLVTEPGTQQGSHVVNGVPASLTWDASGLRYRLTASNENQSTDHLVEVMRAMRPAQR